MTGQPDQSDFVTPEWTRHGVQPLLIAILVTAQCVALAIPFEPFLPGHSWVPATALALAVALQGVYGTNWLELQGLLVVSRPLYRLGELTFITVIIRVITWLAGDGLPGLDQLRIYVLEPMAFFDAAFILTLSLTIFAWQRAAALGSLFCFLAISKDEAEIYRRAPKGTKQPHTRDRSPLLADYYRGWLWGGVLMLICASVTTFILPSFERTDGPLRPAMTGALLVYVVVGFWLLSQGRLAVMNEHWMVFGMRAQAQVERRWRRASLRVLALVAVVAAFLPFGSTTPMSGVFNTAIALLFKVMLMLHGMVVLIIAGILRFIGFDGMFDLEDETFEPPPPLIENVGEVVANEPINEMIAGSMFWIMVCVAAAFAIIVFLRDRGYVFDWETVARLWHGLRHWFLTMLRGVAAEVDDIRIAIQNVLRVEPGVANTEKSRWRFIRVNTLAPRDQVRYFYFSALRHAERRGVGRRDHQTPLEFAGDLAARWPDAQLDSDALTKAFLTARYTRETIDETAAGVARALWKRLRSALKRKAAS
jgi:hypothetical protein